MRGGATEDGNEGSDISIFLGSSLRDGAGVLLAMLNVKESSNDGVGEGLLNINRDDLRGGLGVVLRVGNENRGTEALGGKGLLLKGVLLLLGDESLSTLEKDSGATVGLSLTGTTGASVASVVMTS